MVMMAIQPSLPPVSQRILRADQGAVMVLHFSLLAVSILLQKILHAMQRSPLEALLSLKKFSHPWLTLTQQPNLQNMLISRLMCCY